MTPGKSHTFLPPTFLFPALCFLTRTHDPGGSVTPETVDELMACPDIDGALVGGASLVAEKFGRIVGFKAPVSA